MNRPVPPGDVTARVARYMVEACDRPLPPAVVQAAKHRILDTLAAIVSGARLKPGEMAVRYVRAQGGVPEASVFATNVRTSAVNAVLANAMAAHADETDDADPVTKSHPGAPVVSAALAVGERDNRSGADLIRGVALGYDFCCRWLRALGPVHVRATHRSAEAVGSTFGAVAAAAAMARLDEAGMRYALSYGAQQVSGVWSWERDLEHVEKAFDFSGMGARKWGHGRIDGADGLDGCAERAGRRAQCAAGPLGRSAPRGDAGRAGRAVLRHRDDDQNVFGRPAHAGAARRVLQAETRAWPHVRQRGSHRGPAAGRRGQGGGQPRHARRERPVPARRGPHRRRALVRGQPLVRAREGSAGAGGDGRASNWWPTSR